MWPFCVTDFFSCTRLEKEKKAQNVERLLTMIPWGWGCESLPSVFFTLLLPPLWTSKNHRLFAPHSLAHLAGPTWEEEWRDRGFVCLGSDSLQKALSGSVCCWSHSLYKYSISKTPPTVFFQHSWWDRVFWKRGREKDRIFSLVSEFRCKNFHAIKSACFPERK